MFGKKERNEDSRGDAVELRDFVRTSLVDIATGIHGANDQLMADRGKARKEDSVFFLLGPALGATAAGSTHVEFDVAVTTSATRSGTAKLGASVNVVTAGVGGEKASSSERISRIKFSVLVTENLS